MVICLHPSAIGLFTFVSYFANRSKQLRKSYSKDIREAVGNEASNIVFSVHIDLADLSVVVVG
jgi:hypothetical protein